MSRKNTADAGKAAGKIKKTVVILGYRCNNRCKFCTYAHKRQLAERNTREVLLEILKARNGGSAYLELIGGEPTIRPDIIQLIRFARKRGFETVSITTNGRMFAYGDFARKIRDAGLTHIVLSIHGHNEKLHDSLTQAEGSFKELTKGLRNLQEMDFANLGSNTTIVRQNYRFLPGIGKFIYETGIRNSEFIFVDPTCGGAYEDFERIVPQISKACPYIRKCLDIGRDNRVLHWHIRYVPLCHFSGYENQISEIHERMIFHTQHFAPDFRNFDVENSRVSIGRIKTEKCQGCKKFTLCEGIWREYYKRYGDSELKPFL